MNNIIVALALLLPNQQEAGGQIPPSEVSLHGVAIGSSPARVIQILGRPKKKYEASDYLSLHYDYPDLRVSFSDGIVAGLFTQSPRSCTPRGLCVGDTISRMRALYGQPVVANRGTGKFYEYYGKDLYCWLQIPASGSRIKSITVACQP